MKVELFSKEIIRIGETFVALPLIESIRPVYLEGMRGHGDVGYAFSIKGAFEAKGITIYGNEIEYYKYDRAEFRGGQEEHPVFVDAKVEVLTVRDEVVKLWAEYLGEKK